MSSTTVSSQFVGIQYCNVFWRLLPLQVVVGSFIADGQKESKQVNQTEPSSAGPKLGPGGGATAGSSPSRGTLSESSGGPGSPLNQSTGACNTNNSNPQGMSSMPWK